MKSSVFQTVSHCFMFLFFYKKLLYYTISILYHGIPDTTNFFMAYFAGEYNSLFIFNHAPYFTLQRFNDIVRKQ